MTASASVTRTSTPTRTPGPPVLQISKTSSLSVAAGATLVYTLSYGDAGGTTATSVVLSETVPDHTTFNAAASTAGWSCANGSPAATPCTLSVSDLPPGAHAVALFAVTVDSAPGVPVIRNLVIIEAAGGVSGSANATTLVGPAPAPALSPWGIAAGLAALIGVAWRSGRKTKSAPGASS